MRISRGITGENKPITVLSMAEVYLLYILPYNQYLVVRANNFNWGQKNSKDHELNGP